MRVMVRTRVVGIAVGVVGVLAAMGAVAVRSLEPPAPEDFGIPVCPASAADDLLSTAALECWLDAPHGRWRILAHESVHTALVVHVKAAQLRDAEAIAQRFVDSEGPRASEILLYVDAESPASPPLTRRVRWAPGRGLDVLEFAAEPARPGPG